MNEKEYIIPIAYEVYSTVIVSGVNSLSEARSLVEKHLNEIPLPREPVYIDGSYKIDADTDEDLEIAQSYQTKGVLMTKLNDNEIDYVRL